MSFMIRSERDVQSRIRDVLARFINRKFHGITITEVKEEYDVGDGRRADIAVLKDDGQPLILIETKKKVYTGTGFRAERRFHVMSEEVVGQVISYAAILKRRGVYVPFVATANDSQVAVFLVPPNVEGIVNWDAIRERDYGRTLSYDQYYDLRNRYLLRHSRIRFTDDFFAEILDLIAGIYAKVYRFEEKRQELSWILIEDLRGFVDTLTPFILDAIAPQGRLRDDYVKLVEELAKQKGYTPSAEQLAREMAYVLLNKILFYKILERYYKLDELKPLYQNGVVRTVSEYLKKLREYFDNAVKVTGDFETIFYTGIYDHIDVVESEEALKLFDWLIRLVDSYTIERFGDVIGYVYEDLIPGEERHVLGQFYTPKPVAELIVKWAIRGPDDRVLDPGCGSGTFLVEAYKRLVELKLRRPYKEVRHVPRDVHEQVLSQLYGVDINEFPAHLTSMNLAMKNPRSPSRIIQVVVEDFFNLLPNVKRLMPFTIKTPEGEKPYEIVFGGFDAVVGNPPYTRWTEIPESTQKRIMDVYREVISKYGLTPQVSRGVEPGIYTYWIIHSTKFLKNGGRLGMIISDSWLQTDYGVGFGRFLMDNYKVRAVIDIVTRVFPVPLIGACIVLLEKESDEKKRMENNIVFIMLKPKKQIDVDTVLRLIDEYSGKPAGSSLVADELVIRVVPQREVYESNRKWIHFMFSVEEFLKKLEQNTLTTKLSNYFEASYGNILYLYLTSIGKIRGVRNVGGEEFFYLNEERARGVGIPAEFLYPLLPSSRYLSFFTFTRGDWDELRRNGAECYLFLCHMPRDQLPESVRRYIQMGEGPNAVIRLRRRPGETEGRPVSESQASQERRRHRNLFYDWYDLGGVVQTPIYVSRGTQYWVRFVLSKFNCALDDRILALIPRQGINFSETELKALLAFLNSSFSQLQAEVRGRSTGGGMLELDVKPLSEFTILDVKKLPRDAVERLVQLFDRLESEARMLGGADEVENVYGFEVAREITGRNDIRPNIQGLYNTVIKEIDYEIGRILGFSDAEVEALRLLVVEMARRRLSRAKEPKPEALKGSEEMPVRASKKRKKEEGAKPTRRLDEFFSSKKQS